MARVRFDIDLLDAEDPFEIDEDNRPHLYKHVVVEGNQTIGLTEDHVYEIYLWGDPQYFPATSTGPADWLMVGDVDGHVITVPLAPPHSGVVTQCRPIGVYKASVWLAQQYGRGEDHD